MGAVRLAGSGGSPLVFERYREEFGRVLDPFAHGLARRGVSANALTATSLVFAVLAAIALAYGTAEDPILLVAAAALVGLNAILDAADGQLARITATDSRRGDYLDHVVDRYADVAILLGIAFNPAVDMRLGVLAIVGTFLTSYMGTQAQALGLGREYRGLLGRADRLILLIAVPLLEAARLLAGVALPYDLNLLNLLLAWFAIVGNLTAVQRFWFGWKELGRS